MTEDIDGVLLDLREHGWISLLKFSVLADVSYQTVLKMRDRHEIHVIKVGSVGRVYATEVRRFLTEGSADVSQQLENVVKTVEFFQQEARRGQALLNKPKD